MPWSAEAIFGEACAAAVGAAGAARLGNAGTAKASAATPAPMTHHRRDFRSAMGERFATAHEPPAQRVIRREVDKSVVNFSERATLSEQWRSIPIVGRS